MRGCCYILFNSISGQIGGKVQIFTNFFAWLYARVICRSGIWIIQTSFKVRDAFTSATLFSFDPIEIWFGNFLVKITFEFDPQLPNYWWRFIPKLVIIQKDFANLLRFKCLSLIPLKFSSQRFQGSLLATELRGLSTRNFWVLIEVKPSSLNDLLCATSTRNCKNLTRALILHEIQ